jgi:D-methionine transport system substrate-binding protein
MLKKTIAIGLLLIGLVGALTGCGSTTAKTEDSKQKLVIGVTAGPHEQVLTKVKEVAAKQGLEIELKVFNDYVQPNIALADKQLDLNVFQHEPYLEKFRKDKNLDIVSIAKAVTFPMGIYSTKVKDLKELKDKAIIGLPNDPTNAARAYQLFEAAGLITLKPGAGLNAKASDILNNPKNLVFKELDAAFIPRSLSDLDLAAINTNFAIKAGLKPTKDAIFMEAKDSVWVNIIAARTAEKDKEIYKKFVAIYQSPEVKEYIEKNFDGAVVAAW